MITSSLRSLATQSVVPRPASRGSLLEIKNAHLKHTKSESSSYQALKMIHMHTEV